MLDMEHFAQVSAAHPNAAQAQVKEFRIGNRDFAFNSHPAVMGVVNLSPDSWYRESVCLSTDAAVQRGRVLAAQGADMVDVGAESTLAHAGRVDAAMQTQRLLPVIRGLREAGILVSTETYHPEVARVCLEAGANVLNLTGTEFPDEFFRLAADHDAAVIVCYVQGRNVRDVSDFRLTSDPIGLMHDYFARQIESATRNGVNRILIDPGLGFYYGNLQDGKARVRHQMRVFLNTFRLRTLGWPVCHALPHAFEFFRDEVRSAEAFFAVLARLGRTDVFRTHEVPRVRAVLDAMETF